MVAGDKLNKAGKAFGKVERKLFVEQFSRKELSTEYNDILLFYNGEHHCLGEEGSVPKDAGDFGRCKRLLNLLPEWKTNHRGVGRLMQTQSGIYWQEQGELGLNEYLKNLQLI